MITRGDDRGAGTVLVLGVVAAVLAACLAAAALVGDLVDQARVQAVADGAAIAGARHLRAEVARGGLAAGGCEAAREAALRTEPGARVVGCVTGPGIRIEIEVRRRGRGATAAAAAVP